MLLSSRSIARVSEVVGAFGWGEEVEEVADLAPGLLDGPGLGLSHEVLEFGEELLDRVEVGAVGRQEQQMSAGCPDGAAGGLALVAAEVVEDDDIARGQGRDEDFST